MDRCRSCAVPCRGHPRSHRRCLCARGTQGLVHLLVLKLLHGRRDLGQRPWRSAPPTSSGVWYKHGQPCRRESRRTRSGVSKTAASTKHGHGRTSPGGWRLGLWAMKRCSTVGRASTTILNTLHRGAAVPVIARRFICTMTTPNSRRRARLDWPRRPTRPFTGPNGTACATSWRLACF